MSLSLAELTVQGKEIEASSVVLKAHGMQIAGNGGYDLRSEHLHGHVEGHDICCRNLRRCRGEGGCGWNGER